VTAQPDSGVNRGPVGPIFWVGTAHLVSNEKTACSS